MLSLRDRRSRSKQSHHCATGAAGRSNLITAPPAQPVEVRRHCETGAADGETGAARASSTVGEVRKGVPLPIPASYATLISRLSAERCL